MINFIFNTLYAHGVEEHVANALEHNDSLGGILVTLHPKLVHFPIAIIMLVLLFEILYIFKKTYFFEQIVRWLFQLGILASGVAVATGLLAAETIGHTTPSHDLVHNHRNIMIIASILWLITSIALQFWPDFKGKFRNIFRIAIVIIAALFIWGTHEGGELVYEHGVGVEPVMKTWQKKASSSEGHDNEQNNHKEHQH